MTRRRQSLPRDAEGRPRSRWRAFRSADPHAPAPTALGAPDAGTRNTRLSTHYLRYSTGSALVMVAGFISFSILSHLLDYTQYGILGYYDTWVLIAVAVGKLGAQHTVLRFYPHGSDAARWRGFVTNLYYVPLMLSTALWAMAGIALAVVDLTGDVPHSSMLWMAFLMAPMLIIASLTEMVLRAGENSQMVMYNRVGWRWLELVLTLGLVISLSHSAVAAYGGRFLAAAVAIVFYARWIRRNLPFDRSAVDWAETRAGMAYGLPMVANELIAVALMSLDRLMIKHMLGDFAPLGVYAIGASLAMQVNVFLGITMFEAFAPMANRLFDTEGADAVRALKVRMLAPLTYAAAGVALELGLFGTDALVALSGHSKAASGPVFSYMGIIFALQPVLTIVGYGLLLQKRSGTVMLMMIGTLALNAALNLLWIPRYGVMGAVYATAVSSAVQSLVNCVLVPKGLLQWPAARTLTAAGLAAGLCVAAVQYTGLYGVPAGWPRLIIGGCSVALAYATVVLALDPALRTLARDATAKVLARLVPAAA